MKFIIVSDGALDERAIDEINTFIAEVRANDHLVVHDHVKARDPEITMEVMGGDFAETPLWAISVDAKHFPYKVTVHRESSDPVIGYVTSTFECADLARALLLVTTNIDSSGLIGKMIDKG